LLDDDICIREAHDKRRQRPRYVVRCIPDRADIGSRYQAGSRDAKTVRRSMEVIDFSSGRASEILREVFAKAITSGGRGLC
jgi:DNA ligase 4